MTASSSPTSKRFHISNVRLRTSHVAACGALGLSAVAFAGCGGGEEADGPAGFDYYGNGGASVAGVGGRSGGAGSSNTATPGLGGSGSTSPNLGTGGSLQTCTGGDCMMQPPTMVMTQPCTANDSFCQDGAVALCSPSGTEVSTFACATGSTCVEVAGTPQCQIQAAPTAPPCMANQVFCSTANEIGRCNAEGTSFAAEPCPVGTNCTGAGVCQPVTCNQQGMLSTNGGGGVTVYWFAQGTIRDPNDPEQDVNCRFEGTRAFPNDDGGNMDRVALIQDPELFGAMNIGQYAGAAACGACVQLNPVNGGQPVTITVADSCNPANNNPTCTNGHIDLSRAAFQRLTNMSTGDLSGISWRYVPCAGVDNVQFQLKKPDDQYWNEFLVVGHRYPIVKAEVMVADGPAPGTGDGQWVAAVRQSYNYWRPPAGDGRPEGHMGTYRVRVTDINGSVVEQQLTLRGGLQGGTTQFGCQ